MTRPSFVLLALPILFSCGGSGHPKTASPGDDVTPPASSKEWRDMNHAERKQYMTKVVFPKMSAEFAAIDAKRYEDFSCETCHGDGAKDESFKMPNPKLPVLDFSDGLAKWKEKSPAMLEFMGKQVEPDMAALVHEAPFDMKTGKGFGCLECHTKAP